MNDSNHRRRRVVLTATCGVVAGSFLLHRLAAAAEADEVTANEDLMREHGIIRRILLVYLEAARRAENHVEPLPLPSLRAAARLMRSFGEDYHERQLEEAHIFPVVRKLHLPVAKLPEILLEQHRRGRAITEAVLQIGINGTVGDSQAAALSQMLRNFVLMYEPHAAREDTELFPAWKKALGSHAYKEMGERFEEIEQKTFGHDGFDDALRRITRIEAEFGLSDLSAATAPPPPVVAPSR
jgi:hemerythrin-like domain-containing protein